MQRRDISGHCKTYSRISTGSSHVVNAKPTALDAALVNKDKLFVVYVGEVKGESKSNRFF